MPSVVRIQNHDMPTSNNPHSKSGIIKFTNCLLAKGNELVDGDLWISTISGKILNGQEILYGERLSPEQIIDLGGRILSPGLIDVQLNGGFGFDFSVIPDEGVGAYGKGVARVNRSLVATGVTSYLPTLTSQRSEVYQKALPFLGPSGSSRNPNLGSESLGAHCEGPFLNPQKNGIHNVEVLQCPVDGISDLVTCYGASNLPISHVCTDKEACNHDSCLEPHASPSPIKLITLAPELAGALSCIPTLRQNSILVSIGHSEASYETARRSITVGATMITHLFNAMSPLHHRNPGIFGLLGSPTSALPTPYFGIIADGIHLHPTSLNIAYRSHPSGLILVTDAMRFAGMPDGTYDWTNGSKVVKIGPELRLEENGRIAGSSAGLVDCVNNFVEWTGVGVAVGLRAATEVPARMLGVDQVKGTLREGADADLVVLGREGDGPRGKLVVDQVWKFGVRVFDREV